MSEWISVGTRVPEPNEYPQVLALLADEDDPDLKIIITDGKYVRTNPSEFTHWMPIPPFP